jgi:putative endonuclease
MTKQRQALGRYGEQVAVARLIEDGMVILERNWRCPEGEVDVVARDGSTLVMCEVKTRRAGGSVPPEEAVTAAKADRLRRLADCWLRDHDVRPPAVRIDVLTVWQPERGAAVVDHVRGAV